MADEYTATVRIRRPAKIQSDGRGRSVWTDPVENAEFELVSTVELKKILMSNDEATRQGIEAAAESGEEGVLARDIATGLFEIVSDTQLQAVLDSDLDQPTPEKGADVTYESAHDSEQSIDDLSLVSTLALKKILAKEETTEPDVCDTDDSGLDPYNTG